MVGVFVHAAEAFSIDDDEIGVLLVGTGDGFLPEPEAFGAGVDGGAYLEAAFLLVQQHAVHEEALACAVLAHDRDDAKGAIFGQGQQEVLGLFGESEADALLVSDEGDCESGLAF